MMPQGVLFHGGREGSIRQKMIETDCIECVITLVGNLFYGAGVSACILFLNNNKPLAHRGKICMIDATNIYTAQRAKNILTESDTDQVYRLWQDYKDWGRRSRTTPRFPRHREMRAFVSCMA